jgi:hypothetical protein
MTPAQVRNEIEQLITTLFEAKLALDSNKPLALPLGGGTLVTWSNDVSLSALFDRTSALDEYLATLRNRWYTAILFDGAMLQVSYTFTGDSLKKHRLSFYPCPIHFTSSECEQYTIQELIELLDGNEFRDRIRLEGPLRFDFDLDAGTNDHPASHLTISRTSCRIPISAPLSLGHFVRFLFRHFYPAEWAGSKALREWACSTGNACLPDIEEDHLYVHWKRRI